jgi:SAM-dependent methyltransferase
MDLQAREVALNWLAGFAPLRSRLRRLRDRGKAANPEAIVRYTLERLGVRRRFLGDDRIQEAELLEIGSGRECGLALLLLALGAKRVVNVEIDAHGFIFDAAFYRLLVDKAREAGLSIEWPPAGLAPTDRPDRVAADPGRLTLYLDESARSMREPDSSFDTTFSVAVFEHVRKHDVLPVLSELRRVTRPGGMGFHRIDLVDHYYRRADPFRLLRLSAREYDLMYSNRGSSSNRFRMDDYEALARRAGFAGVRFEDVQYYEDEAAFGRWVPSFHPDFRHREPGMLRATSCMMVLSR